MIPLGLCQCGCGQRTSIARDNDAGRGFVKGQPHRFARGHRLPTDWRLRFWDKVDVTSNPNGCWIWTGSRRGRGYGQIGASDGVVLDAHRASWELHFGPIPDGTLVCHHCDNPPCVRPDHLFLGTHADNTADMVAKGRRYQPTVAGESNGRSKLAAGDVFAIRASDRSIEDLARLYGVSAITITQIRTRKTWTHLP